MRQRLSSLVSMATYTDEHHMVPTAKYGAGSIMLLVCLVDWMGWDGMIKNVTLLILLGFCYALFSKPI